MVDCHQISQLHTSEYALRETKKTPDQNEEEARKEKNENALCVPHSVNSVIASFAALFQLIVAYDGAISSLPLLCVHSPSCGVCAVHIRYTRRCRESHVDRIRHTECTTIADSNLYTNRIVASILAFVLLCIYRTITIHKSHSR